MGGTHAIHAQIEGGIPYLNDEQARTMSSKKAMAASSSADSTVPRRRIVRWADQDAGPAVAFDDHDLTHFPMDSMCQSCADAN